MIVTTIMGGLGNQLFQYAAGRAAALRTGRPLVLDATLLPSPADGGLRRLDLPQLPIAAARTLRRPGRRGRERPPSAAHAALRPLLRRALRRWTVVDPMTHDVLVDLTRPPGPVALLHGYWQSHRYFADLDDLIRSELTPDVPRGGRVNDLLRATDGRDLVALHVRRGDYVTDPGVARVFGTQGEGYYRSGCDHVLAGCDRPIVVVVSDDPAWAAANLDLGVETLHPELEGPLVPVEVLAVISRARHAVIANSSLSWWGAWLGSHATQRVVAPRRWFAGREVDPVHRFPPSWTLR